MVAVLLVAQACSKNKQCETFDAEGSYTASIQLSFQRSGGGSPASWDTSYTDILKVSASDSPYSITIENWPFWAESFIRKTTEKFELKKGESAESNPATGKPYKKCPVNAYQDQYVSDGVDKMQIGQGSLSYNLSETYGGSGGRIINKCTITAYR